MKEEGIASLLLGFKFHCILELASTQHSCPETGSLLWPLIISSKSVQPEVGTQRPICNLSPARLQKDALDLQ